MDDDGVEVILEDEADQRMDTDDLPAEVNIPGDEEEDNQVGIYI